VLPAVLLSLSLSILAPCLAQPPDVGARVGVGEIDERRSTEGEGRFRLDLRLLDRPVGTLRVHAQVTKASDDKGRDLTGVPEDVLSWTDFDANEIAEAEWKARNPARGAVKIAEMSGAIEAFVPAHDPDATLTLDGWLKYLGAPLEEGTLAQNGIAVRMLSPAQYAALPRQERDAVGLEAPDNSVLFLINDPGHRLVGISFLNEAGRAIRGSGDDSNDRALVLRFNRPVPGNARLRLLIATPKAVIAVPFALSNIELP